MPSGLLDVPALGSVVAGNGLAVGHLRYRRGRLHTVLALQLLQRHVQVHVAEPRDDQLMRLLDPVHVQRRILFRQACEAARDLFLVATRLGRDGHAVREARQVDGRQRAAVLGAQRVAGQGVSELGRRSDVAGLDLRRRYVLLAAREEDLRQALVGAAVDVREVLVGLDRSSHDLEVADASELVAAGAEDERLRRL